MKNILLLLACNLAVFTYASAVTVTWTGGGGDTNWMNGANWDMGVPTAADDVDIEDATVVLSSSTTVQRIDLFGSGDLTIDAGVTLTITGFAGNEFGFDVNNSAMVTNNGTVSISNITGGTAADGLYVRGTFINDGTITINNIGRHGLYVIRGNLTNNAGATITITDAGQVNTDGDNLYVDDSGGNLGLLTNNGTITLTKTNATGDDAIYVNDGSTFENNGMISISVTGSGNNAIRLDDGGIFNNNMGATFAADGGTDDQILVDNSNAVFNNLGTIDLDNVDSGDGGLYVIDGGTFNNGATGIITIDGGSGIGILMDANGNATPATLNNSGSITVQNMGSDGARLRDDAVFNNLSGGTLTLNTSGDEGIDVRSESGENINNVLTNAGTIIINGTTGVGIDLIDGTITNDGTLDLDNSGQNTFNIVDASVFTNNATGVVTIDDGNSNGIQIDANANATPANANNSGSITIQNAGSDGLRLRDDGIFNNLSGGTLTLNTSGDEGVDLNSETGENLNNALNNAGTITINGCLGHGIDLVDGLITNDGMISLLAYGNSTSDDGIRAQGGNLTNNAGATLAINGGSGDDAIELDDPSIINNSGTINITNADDHGIDIQGTLNNMSGGLFQVSDAGDDGLRMQGGVVNNDGAIQIDNSFSDDIETDDNPFNNTANATFAPGSSPGDLVLEDNIDLGLSTITFEITGTTPATQYDQIIHGNSTKMLTISNATATLDWGSFVPAVNDVFTIVDGSSDIVGEFATINSSNPSIVYTANYTSNVNEVRIVVTAILPVELVHFAAKKSDRGAELSWETATEINNEGFDIERSRDNKTWTKIGYVAGNGNSDAPVQYAYLDNAPSKGMNYYRLKQSDFDGQFEYSRVVALNFENENTNFTVSPNPVKDVLNIDLNPELENMEIQLFDSSGKLLWATKETVQQIPFGKYNAGVYFLKVVSSTNQTVQKIIHN